MSPAERAYLSIFLDVLEHLRMGEREAAAEKIALIQESLSHP